jgi:predicted MFS family arabinose efflux permease
LPPHSDDSRAGSVDSPAGSVDSPLPGRSRFIVLFEAVALSLGMGIALGMARFSYALLLPPMKADLGWSFVQAGTMNTVNAAGYLIGALMCPWLLRRWSAAAVFNWGCLLTTVMMGVCAFLVGDTGLLTLRLASGIGSALIVVCGGVLAARLASEHPRDSGLLLGIYYGGTGWGVVMSSLLVPVALTARTHGWQSAWLALAIGCAVFSVGAIWAARKIGHAAGGGAVRAPSRVLSLLKPKAAAAATSLTDADTAAPASTAQHATALHARIDVNVDTDAGRTAPHAWPRFAWALASYGLFGVGYIGYMTFVIALLREAGMSATVVIAFYLLLGVAIVISARLWARLLDRARGGGALALLNVLLGVATLLPAVFTHPAAAFISGALFGATFLSVVTSTTAFVRHNLPAARWGWGISAFTVVFAFGQIVGPVAIGHVSDGAGLARGFVYSGAVLFCAALLAMLQRPLHRA